jgi:tetratricopeptide (TPR) repeat protein
MPKARSVLLALSLLSACAASDPDPDQIPAAPSPDRTRMTGAYGNYLAGRAALAGSEFPLAAGALLSAARAEPRNGELVQQAFVACLMAGRPEADVLARILPDNPIARLRVANLEAKAGNWDTAVKLFQSLPNQGPLQIVQPLLLAWARQGAGQPEAAIATLTSIPDIPQLRGIFALHTALIAELSGRGAEAAAFYGFAAADTRDANIRMAEILASWHARSGRPDDARQTLAELAAQSVEASIALPGLLNAMDRPAVAKATDGLAEAYLAFGASIRAAGTQDLALMVLRLAIDMRPDLAAARLMTAEIHQSRQKPALALGALSDIRDGDALAAIARLRRSILMDKVGRTDDAVDMLGALSRDFPDSLIPDLQLGETLKSRSRFREAIPVYDRAIRKIARPGPADWMLFYGRGVAHDRDGQWGKAEDDFASALALAPDQPMVLNYLGYSWADRGHRLDEALEMIQRAVAQRPNDGAITDSLGWALFRLGRYDDAVKFLERATELEPDDPTINAHLGDAFWATGRKVEAIYQWRRALTMKPSDDDRAKLEERLRPDYAGPVPGAR